MGLTLDYLRIVQQVSLDYLRKMQRLSLDYSWILQGMAHVSNLGKRQPRQRWQYDVCVAHQYSCVVLHLLQQSISRDGGAWVGCHGMEGYSYISAATLGRAIPSGPNRGLTSLFFHRLWTWCHGWVGWVPFFCSRTVLEGILASGRSESFKARRHVAKSCFMCVASDCWVVQGIA